MTANPVGAGSGVTFYLSYRSDAVGLCEQFRRFCRCEYGDLVTAAISAYAKAGATTIQVTETIEIPE